LRQLESACVELTCGTHSMTQCHKKHTLARAHACNNIIVPPQAGDGVGPGVKLPPASANKRNTTRNTQARATRHGKAHASHLNARFFIELDVTEHGELRAGEGELAQGHGDGHVDAHVATFHFELKFSRSGACDENEVRCTAHNLQVRGVCGR